MGRPLINFITWDAVVSIEKKDGLFSVIQKNSSELINSKTTLLQRGIKSKKDFLTFLSGQNLSSVYLIFSDQQLHPRQYFVYLDGISYFNFIKNQERLKFDWNFLHGKSAHK